MNKFEEQRKERERERERERETERERGSFDHAFFRNITTNVSEKKFGSVIKFFIHMRRFFPNFYVIEEIILVQSLNCQILLTNSPVLNSFLAVLGSLLFFIAYTGC